MATTYDKASLVMIPSGVKDGKAYSIKPTDGSGDFTFSRGTGTATRVNASGLIEKERANLLTYSNTFSNADWGKSGATLTSGQSGYDGSSDAWLLSTSVSSNHIFQNVSFNLNTISIYAKAGSLNWMAINIGGGFIGSYFDLANGVVGSAQNAGGGVTIEAKIESVGGGWYRCSVAGSYVNASTTYRIYTASADLDTSGAGSIYIQDAQYEQGLVATDYIETTTAAVYEGITDNLPRLDYSGGASCPSLLLEPSRTNGMPYSEFHNGSAFSLGTNITFNGYVTSPEGVQNAARFTSSNTTSSFIQVPDTIIPAGKFTFSMWVRGVSGTFINRSMYIPSMTGSQATMNEAPVAGEDWKLVYGTGENTTGGSINRQVTLPFYDQPNGATFEVYGFQVEAGSYPTSYIPTYGTAASRAGDEFVKTGIGSLLGSSQGTLFMEVSALSESMGTSIVSLSDGSLDNNLYLGYSATKNEVKSELRTGGPAYFSLSNVLTDVRDTYKVAVVYQNGSGKLFINGALVDSDTSVTTPAEGTFTKFATDFGQGSFKFYSNMKQLLHFKTALTDSEAIALTTI
jgi:hypothetical protein